MFNLYPQLLKFVIWLYDVVNCGRDFEGTATVSGIVLVVLILTPVIVGFILNLLERLEFKFFCFFFGYRVAFYIVNYVTIAGTILHELSHTLFAFITGAKVTEVSFFDHDGEALGHIAYRPQGPFFLQAIQHSLTACAPVIMGFAGVVITSYFFLTTTYGVWAQILLIYLGISIINHSSMSSIDIKHYFQGIWAVSIPLFIAIFIFCRSTIS